MEIKIINFEKREKKFVSYAINSVFIENLLDEKKIVFNDKLINKIIDNAKIKIIISDNIRIGIILNINKINFLFLLAFSYINNLVNISNLKKLKIINNNLSKLQILNYFKFRIEKENLSNIPLIKSKKLLSEKINNSHKKILILGPKARNKNIINFLENDGNSVYCSLDKYFYKNMCLEKIDIIISSGYLIATVMKWPFLRASLIGNTNDMLRASLLSILVQIIFGLYIFFNQASLIILLLLYPIGIVTSNLTLALFTKQAESSLWK